MRILHVVPSYFPAVRYGGPILSVHNLCKSLVSLGHEVHVYTTNIDGDNNLNVPLCIPVDLDGVKVWYYPIGRLRRLNRAPKLKLSLERNINKFDVVHLHSIFLWPTWVAARAAMHVNVPYLLAPRGMLVLNLIRRKNPIIKNIWINFIEKKTISNAAGLHVTSEEEANQVHQFALPLPPVFNVPNGIDIPNDHLSEDEPITLKPNQPYVLFLGRITWKKGLDRLILAWQHVNNTLLVIAGNDEENYQPELERLAKRLGVRERIKFIGAVSGKQKWALYRQAELFILPSYSENFGNVVLEAMAMGCPVIVTPEVGIASIVEESNAGMVIDGEPQILAEAVMALLGNKQRCEEMGRNGKKTAKNNFSWEIIGKQMEQVYKEIISGIDS